MTRFRILVLSFVVVAAAACSSTAPAASFPPGTVPPTAQPSVAPSIAPVAVVAKPVVAVNPSLSLYEWKVIAPSTLKAGTTTFVIGNFGTIQHELLIFKSNLDASAYPKDAKGDIIEDGPGINLLSDGENIDPAGTQTRTVHLTPGTYLFVCNIPGHFKNGMVTAVTVTK